LNFTFEFRIVLTPNYSLMILIRISVTQGVTVDNLTKPLARVRFQELCRRIGVVKLSSMKSLNQWEIVSVIQFLIGGSVSCF
jgi:hypothetical protein